MRDPAALSKKKLIQVVKTVQSEHYWPSGHYGIPVDIHRVLKAFGLHKLPPEELPVPDLVYVETRGTPIPAILDRLTNGYAVVSKWFGFKKGWGKPIRVPRERIVGPLDPADPEIVDMIHQTWYPAMKRRILTKLEKQQNGLGDATIHKHPAVLYDEIVTFLAANVGPYAEKFDKTPFDASMDLVWGAIKARPIRMVGLIEKYTNNPFPESGEHMVEQIATEEGKRGARAVYSMALDVEQRTRELPNG